MHFEYEITSDDYVACQLLNYRLRRGGKRVPNAVGWIFIGGIFVLAALMELHNSDPAVPILPAVVGALFIYIGVTALSPAGTCRRAYQRSQLAGKRFQAEINADGFEVTGDVNSWRVRWDGVLRKGEDDRVFILFSAGTLFMFGKQYLTCEQQNELRRLSGLT